MWQLLSKWCEYYKYRCSIIHTTEEHPSICFSWAKPKSLKGKKKITFPKMEVESNRITKECPRNVQTRNI